jgi:predicted RNase H-like HicB family nuclease
MMYNKVVLLPTADGGYTAEVPGVPGMTCYGETFDVALDTINDMIRDYAARCEEDTQEIQRPTGVVRA